MTNESELTDKQKAAELVRSWHADAAKAPLISSLLRGKDGRFTNEASQVNIELYRGDRYPEPVYVALTLIERNDTFARKVLTAAADQERSNAIRAMADIETTGSLTVGTQACTMDKIMFERRLNALNPTELGDMLEQTHSLLDSALQQPKVDADEVGDLEWRFRAIQRAMTGLDTGVAR